MEKDFNPSIGKDVIESLTFGMYEDSRTIFREYIQNAADQIDKAVKEGLIDKEECEIHITIDPEARRIIIEDNATGIAQSKVAPILQNIATSTKERGVDKGFRGIGRLGGLAYCGLLIFETSFKGENSKSILTWNATLLREIINNRNQKDEAVSVIKKITSFETKTEKTSEHYFKVILEGVTVDMLLDIDGIRDYLQMVAPLPFPAKFIFKNEILKELIKEGIQLDEYKIYLDKEQLFKGYSTYIYEGDHLKKRKIDEIIDIIFFKELDDNNKLLYWGWYGVSMLNRQLKSVNKARGFRLRNSNIQIGNEYTLIKLHREGRFNSYFFGEVYGISSALIPNSRRDYFIENGACIDFEKRLKEYFHIHIYKLCHTASEINSSLKKIEDLKIFEQEFKQKQQEGFIDKSEHLEYREKFESKKDEAVKAQKKLEKIGEGAGDADSGPVRKILKKVAPAKNANNIEAIQIPAKRKVKLRVNSIRGLSKDEKALIGKVFLVIREVLDPNMAENLIQKIEDEI